LPSTLSYEDIDREFKTWVDEALNIVQDGVKLPTMVLYSNQRFSEYMQTWKYTDENNNIRLNFKTVTRENNPSHGTILGETYNIAGDKFYKLHSIQAVDESGKKYRLDYKMKQPTPVDLNYKISILTNKYTSINEFNEIVNHAFNAKQSYICPKGHYMSLILENISDESEYNIEDRQFFSQNFTIKVRGYIIREEDFRVEENPIAAIVCFEGDDAKRRKPTIEISEYDPCFIKEEMYYKKPLSIDIDLCFCFPYKGKIKFTIDEDFTLTGIEMKEPVNIMQENIKLYVNGNLVSDDLTKDCYEGYKMIDEKPSDSTENNTITCDELPFAYDKLHKYILFNGNYYIWHNIHFSDGDEIVIEAKRIKNFMKTGGIVLNGYNRLVVLSV
jgi:hypothetical protein